ncbi:protein ecdysoneless [Anopheles maculipalpis]|uniref:protein ecdysoneless n=1 Tax=Anopheles maculipalpis TaxID=1496333 RepID=UPI00215981B4|nr:protein ecdysoneless [Anopheles maculipalpis]
MSYREILQSIREDDFVEYFLFPARPSDPSDVELENCENSLESLLQEVNRLAEAFCQRYIWHRDAFRVVPRLLNDSRMLIEAATGEHGTASAKLPSHLYGISHVGDNIQDEWFIVALLFHLTERIPGLVARVVDADGEFLLIEAAEQLPRWANPESCEGKVFICDGTLRLVQSTEADESLDVQDALEMVRGTEGKKYCVSEEVDRCIRERIQGFPDEVTDHQHRATVNVPVGVAAVLRENPQLVAPAVLAFCGRDPIDLKACRAMRYFPPENCVNVSVTFTKCLYAMLAQSRYLPDRRTGWSIPLSTDPEYKAHMLGVKLACGFEILASQAKTSRTDWETDKGWKSYYESLKAKGYFRDNIEGSQEHTKLLTIAREYYVDNKDSMRTTPKIGEEIVSILKRNEWDVEELRKEGLDLPPADSDDWMNISPEELDQMLTKRYGAKKLFSLNGNTNAAETFTSMVNDFLEQKSEFDGVVVDNENEEEADRAAKAVLAKLDLSQLKSPTKPKRTKSKNAHDRQQNQQQNSKHASEVQVTQESPFHQSATVEFDAGAFGMHVRNMLDLLIPEDRWDSSDESDMSDYSQDEYDRNIEDMSPTRTHRAVQSELKTYMDQMDRELAGTTIGKSFETAIDGEDAATDAKPASSGVGGDDFDDIESFKPVNIDMNTLKNMMESYQSQIGGPGPAANLLGSMGIQISKAGGGGSSSKPEKGSTQQTDV